MLQIVTDSSCDLPEEILKKYNIHVVPLTVNIDGETFTEKVNITPKEFYAKMAASKNLPKTSQPAPSLFAEKFKQLTHLGQILCITISSGLSGTFESASHGKKLSEADVTVFDSLGGSLGHGLQVLKAAKLAAAGHSLESIIEKLTEYRDGMTILVLLNTLENIVKGGRLSRFQGTIGRLLDVRILLHNDSEGKVVLKSKARGSKKFMEMIMQTIYKVRPDMSSTDVGITHFNNFQDADFIRRELKEKANAREVIINDMGITMATYAGEGGMIVSF